VSALVTYQLREATRILVDAALAWGDRDYGEAGELEADAALNDAIREFKRVLAEQAVVQDDFPT
jgi:hypothetical protein